MTPTSVVYFIRAGGRVKIGFTADIGRRFSNLRAGSSEKLELLATVPGDAKTEKALHGKFAAARAHGEWFNLTRELSTFIEEIRAGNFTDWPKAAHVEAMTSKGKLRMTPKRFFGWVELLLGADWPSLASGIIGVSRQTLWRWKMDAENGICSVTPQAVMRMNEECERRMAEMRFWIGLLKEDLSSNDDTKRAQVN